MPPKTTKDAAASSPNGRVRADQVAAADVLSVPQVRAPALPDLAPQAAVLAAAEPKAYQKDEKHETVETTSEKGEDGSKTDTTTTTTTESTTTRADEEEEPSSSAGSSSAASSSAESSSKSSTGASAAKPGAVRPGVATRAGTVGRASAAEVLRLVKEITGSSSPDEQIGALTGLQYKAGKADKYREKVAALKSELAGGRVEATVEKAIREGKLTPAQKEWAMKQSPETLKGFLKTAAPVIRPAARPPAAKAPNRRDMPIDGSTGAPVDAAIAEVARTMQLDPAKVAEHAAELRKAGVIH